MKRPRSRRKIRPEFTEAQAGEIRVALKDTLEFRTENGMDTRAAQNALDELDRAQREADYRTTERPLNHSQSRRRR